MGQGASRHLEPTHRAIQFSPQVALDSLFNPFCYVNTRETWRPVESSLFSKSKTKISGKIAPARLGSLTRHGCRYAPLEARATGALLCLPPKNSTRTIKCSH